MNKTFFLLILSLFLFACNTEKKQPTKEVSKEKEEYYSNGSLKSKGLTRKDGKPIGLWEYYDEQGNIERIAEYIEVQNKSFLNQDWVINNEGDTINSKSCYYNLLLEKDTISLNEPIKAKIDMTAPFFKGKYSETYVIIPKDYSVNFNKDFSNIEQVDLDTIYNLEFNPELKEKLELTTNWGKTVIFGRYFETPGPKKLRGILVEFNIKDSILPDSTRLNYWTHKKYFEREITVKE